MATRSLPRASFWTAFWQSSFRHVLAGFSTYVTNAVEFNHKADAIATGPTKGAMTVSLFTNVEEACAVWVHDSTFAAVWHVPTGVHRYQHDLIRGPGRMSKRSCLYTKQFRRLTVTKIKAIVESDAPFVVDAGCRPLFTLTWVMPKRSAEAFDRAAMVLYADLMFAKDVDEVLRLCPKDKGHLHINKVKYFMAEFVIVGRKADQTLVDLHRDGMINGTSEHLLYILSLNGVDFGPLHGTSKPKTRAPVPPQTKDARKHAREVLLGPHAQVERPTRPEADLSQLAHEALEDKPTSSPKNPFPDLFSDADSSADTQSVGGSAAGSHAADVAHGLGSDEESDPLMYCKTNWTLRKRKKYSTRNKQMRSSLADLQQRRLPPLMGLWPPRT